VHDIVEFVLELDEPVPRVARELNVELCPRPEIVDLDGRLQGDERLGVGEVDAKVELQVEPLRRLPRRTEIEVRRQAVHEVSTRDEVRADVNRVLHHLVTRVHERTEAGRADGWALVVVEISKMKRVMRYFTGNPLTEGRSCNSGL